MNVTVEGAETGEKMIKVFFFKKIFKKKTKKNSFRQFFYRLPPFLFFLVISSKTMNISDYFGTIPMKIGWLDRSEWKNKKIFKIWENQVYTTRLPNSDFLGIFQLFSTFFDFSSFFKPFSFRICKK